MLSESRIRKSLLQAGLQNTQQYKNNRAENSHLHFRRREHGMNRFRSMRSLQKFVSIYSSFLNHFNHQRPLETRQTFKNLRQNSVNSWQEIFALKSQPCFWRIVIVCLTALSYHLSSNRLLNKLQDNFYY